MTNRERAQVVELLRCAADVDGIGEAYRLITGQAVRTGDRRFRIWSLAVDARTAASQWETSYVESCLEAALLVEQGELL